MFNSKNFYFILGKHPEWLMTTDLDFPVIYKYVLEILYLLMNYDAKYSSIPIQCRLKVAKNMKPHLFVRKMN
jgi:hypothetical protein